MAVNLTLRGPVHAEEDAAGTLAADENSFGNFKGAWFQLVLIAKGGVDVSSKVAKVVNLKRIARHGVQTPRGWMIGVGRTADREELAV